MGMWNALMPPMIKEIAGNGRSAPTDDRKQDARLFKMQPHLLAIKGLQEKYATLDPQAKDYSQNVDQITQELSENIGEVRRMMTGDKTPEEAAKGNIIERGVTDRLHLTNPGKRKEKAEKKEAGDVSGARSYEQGTVPPANPYVQERTQLSQAGFAPDEISQALRSKAGILPKDTTEQERFVTDYMHRNPGKTQEDALRAYTDATTKDTGKAPPEMKPVEAGGVPYGVSDPASGKQYLPSQLGPNGDAPPEAKQIWKTIQDAKAAKQAEEDKKENDRAERQARTIAAGFERMGRSQEFQEQMAQYRSDLTSYRALNTAADNSEVTVTALKQQYAQPGNKSVADNELQNFYTTVVQKGGRKTAAELNLTLKIGSFGMNLQQMASKAATGELPDALRKSLLDGMSAVAEEQRKAAELAKPELPEITGAHLKGHQALKKTRNAQQGGVIVVSPEDMK